MNSESQQEHWEELWRRQPMPAPIDESRVLRDVREAERVWGRDSADSDRIVYLLAAIAVAPRLLALASKDGAWWGDWVIAMVGGGMVTTLALFGWRRWRVERDFGRSLLERIERGRALVRLRRRMLALNYIFAAPLGLMAGAMLHRWTGGLVPWPVGLAVSLPPFVWWAAAHNRKYHADMTSRLAQLDELQVQLRGTPGSA